MSAFSDEHSSLTAVVHSSHPDLPHYVAPQKKSFMSLRPANFPRSDLYFHFLSQRKIPYGNLFLSNTTYVRFRTLLSSPLGSHWTGEILATQIKSSQVCEPAEIAKRKGYHQELFDLVRNTLEFCLHICVSISVTREDLISFPFCHVTWTWSSVHYDLG